MTFFQILFSIFLLVPVIEIYLLIKVGGLLGAFPTIFLIVFTAVLGAWLLRIQGFSTLQRVQQSFSNGKIPAIEMMEGLVLAVAGALLLTPGFFTDTIGFILLVPVCRRWIIKWLLSRSTIFQVKKSTYTHYNDPSPERTEPRVIDGEYRREDN